MSTTSDASARFATLDEQLTGELFLPGNAGYDELATPWNLAAPGRPGAVIAADGSGDIAAVLRFATDNGLQVAVQATGHGAAGIDEDTLLVHTGRFQQCIVHADGWARVGAGVRWTAVLEAAAAHGLVPLAGSAPAVGVVGYTTAGGVGPLVRSFGAASDRVRAFDLVTADGHLRRATPTQNPSLFWGLRGGKGALGIVTAIEFDLVELDQIYGGCWYFDGADAPAVAHAYREWAHGLPGEASTSLALLRFPAAPGVPEPLAGRLAVAVRYAWTGDPTEGARYAAPIGKFAAPVMGGIDMLPCTELGSIHSDPVDPLPLSEEAALLRELPAEAIDALLASAGPTSDCPLVMVDVRQLGGALARGGEHPSALSYRDAAFSLMTIGVGLPPVVEATKAGAAAILDAVAPWSTGHLLPHLGASHDPADVARKYDDATLSRLATLAARYDPAGVLQAAGPIRRAAASIQK